MDSRLDERLSKLDDHIVKLFHVEHEYLTLKGIKDGLLASLTNKALGKSQAERESLALASDDKRQL